MAAAATPTLARSYSRILVASADEAFRKHLIKRPAYMRALSEEAVGGAHALATLAHFSCDSVLLDRHLPDLDAAEVAATIRQRYPQTKSSLSIREQGATLSRIPKQDRRPNVGHQSPSHLTYAG